MERRSLTSQRPRLVRSADGKPPKISGYAAVYYREGDPSTEYELYSDPGFRLVERILPPCFARACKEDDVRCLMNHDPSLLLGRNRSGTLRLTVDSVGLQYECLLPDTTYAADLRAVIARGDLGGSSFSFDYLDLSRRDIQDGSNLTRILEVRDVKLFDVSCVTYPAYEATSARFRKHGSRINAEVKRLRADSLVAEAARLCPTSPAAPTRSYSLTGLSRRRRRIIARDRLVELGI